ncbi:MAG: hypothetical protein HLUCCA12_12165 [Rhodobacteraceae bacterium HLUCCA12]|nr:MAG: hypothetical protein HLUCCA12_12165 [Rhodobacteraceae bacterium HLUCCA12]
MPERKSETVLIALLAALEAARPAGASLARNVVLPQSIPGAGAMILRDGDPGQPEVTLSPRAYHYEHRAEVDLLIDRAPGARDAAFDALVRAVGAAVAADRTLGGLCDWVEGEAPAPLALAIEGAEGLKAATIELVLHYSTADPLV